MNRNFSAGTRSIAELCAALTLAAITLSCGPKCTEVKSALSDDQVTGEDVARVNKLVAKRKEAMTEAESGAAADLSKLKFSVTAYEIAIETQLRVIKISPKFESSPLYSENRKLFDEMRCSFDELVMEGTPHVISDRVGRDVQQWSQKVGAILREHGKLTPSELREYLEDGIKGASEKEE